MAFATAKELGKKGSYKYTEIACVDCGVLHWVALKGGIPRAERCYSCASRKKLAGIDMTMENNPNWRGGRHQYTDGYVVLTLPETHPYFAMADKLHRVREHRIILAEQLGRPLATNEHSHHKNKIRSDNGDDNLNILTPSEHSYTHHPIVNPVEDGKKKCNKCSKVLPIECFYRSKNRAGKYGYRPQCKACENECRRTNYKARREIN